MFTYDTILYVKNPTESTAKPLELTNEFSKIAVYTSNEQSKNEIEKIMQFTIVSRRINYLEKF